MRQNLIVAGVVAAVLAVFVLGYVALRGGAGPSAMGGTATSGQRGVVPPVKGYLDRTEIRFIHTEASDAQIAQIAQIAQMLTSMMGSPVLVVPSLAQVPPSALANVSVFKNGIKGEDRSASSPDVFENGPHRSGYSPLRAVHVVRWNDPRRRGYCGRSMK